MSGELGGCPVPLAEYPRVLMAHGGGGRLMNELVGRMFGAAFSNPILDRREDAAVMSLAGGRWAFTTDSYVVRPLFFPGGDLGVLAVHGTVNDLAMVGAGARYLSAGFILEEGLAMETLWRVVVSMARAAERCGVWIVTGDTKVVDAGHGDGMYVNTAGVGVIGHGLEIGPRSVCPGDAVLVSGDVGRHGMAVMAVREGLAFETTIESDTASLGGVVSALLREGVGVRCMRDLTRGGLTAALNEIADAAACEIRVVEDAVPVAGDVAAACEVLGMDVMQVACEGRFVVFVPEAEVDWALAAMRSEDAGRGACRIGTVGGAGLGRGRVVMRGCLGGERLLAMPSGEQMPRIC